SNCRRIASSNGPNLRTAIRIVAMVGYSVPNRPRTNAARTPRRQRRQRNGRKMEQTLFYEDYVIGDVRTTHGRTITETDFVVHAGHSGDFFPHHLDAEVAQSTPLRQRT